MCFNLFIFWVFYFCSSHFILYTIALSLHKFAVDISSVSAELTLTTQCGQGLDCSYYVSGERLSNTVYIQDGVACDDHHCGPIFAGKTVSVGLWI